MSPAHSQRGTSSGLSFVLQLGHLHSSLEDAATEGEMILPPSFPTCPATCPGAEKWGLPLLGLGRVRRASKTWAMCRCSVSPVAWLAAGEEAESGE